MEGVSQLPDEQPQSSFTPPGGAGATPPGMSAMGSSVTHPGVSAETSLHIQNYLSSYLTQSQPAFNPTVSQISETSR